MRADEPNGVGALEASGGYPEALVVGRTVAGVSAVVGTAVLNENGCGDLEVVGGYIEAGGFVPSFAGKCFADGVANVAGEDEAASALPSSRLALEGGKENGFGAFEEIGG